MSSQVAYVYNAHRHAAIPFRSLLFTHLDKRLKDRLEDGFWKQVNGKRWIGTEWMDGKDIDELWTGEDAKVEKKPLLIEPPSEEEIMTASQDKVGGE